MPEQKKEAKGDDSHNIVKLREVLYEGDFDEAKRIERENLIPPHIVKPVVNTVFDLFLNDKRYNEAIEIGKRYDFTMDKIADVVYMEFRELISKGKFETAIEWGMKNSLSLNDITNAAVKWVEQSIKVGDIKTAIFVKEKYSVKKESVGNLWMNGFSEAYDKSDFMGAALLSREFGMSERKTLLTAIKGFKESVKKEDVDTMDLFEKEFNIFNDVAFGIIGDEEGRALIQSFEKYFDKIVAERDVEKVLKSVEASKILYKVITHTHLKGLLRYIFNNTAELHGNLFQDDEYKGALSMKKGLAFYEDNVPDEIKKKIYEQARDYHNNLLKNKKLESALHVKEDYQLLGELSSVESIESMQREVLVFINQSLIAGNVEGAIKASKEYDVTDNELEQSVSDSLLSLLETYKFEAALQVLLKFKITNFTDELSEAAVSAFSKAIEDGYHEMAAELGYRFKIKDPRVKSEAKIIWEHCMETENYKKARELKIKHRLSKKETNDTAKSLYLKLMDENNMKMAKKIKDDYNVSLGIIAWLIDFIKQLFSIFFPKKEESKQEEAPA